MGRALRGGRALAAALLLPLLLPQAAGAAPPVLGWPLACTPNEDCWIANHVDLDPGAGVRDYRCGALTYEGHNGTDIAVRDRAAMREGVAVLAAAPGRVRGMRDGLADASVREAGKEAIKDRECGNGVVLDHGDGWETQYCHLRRGSVRVLRDEQVAAGQQLGLVGLSGLTEYPHLHFIVRRGERAFDPFLGVPVGGECAASPQPLWQGAVAASAPYAPGAVFNAGFAAEPPDRAAVREGRYRTGAAPHAGSPVLALYAEVFGVDAGDELRLRIAGPDGATLAENVVRIERRQALRYAVIGKRRTGEAWPAGTYRGEVRLVRADGAAAPAGERVVTLEMPSAR